MGAPRRRGRKVRVAEIVNVSRRVVFANQRWHNCKTLEQCPCHPIVAVTAQYQYHFPRMILRKSKIAILQDQKTLEIIFAPTPFIPLTGTAMPSQLPFFVAACDYTLIGEEFFAASAYLSGEKHQLGSLKGQDVGKLFGVILLIVGCLLATFSLDSSKATFTRLDKNRDGSISQSESGQMSKAEFAEIDKDKNNSLDSEEIGSFKSGTIAESLQSATDYIKDNLLGSNGF